MTDEEKRTRAGFLRLERLEQLMKAVQAERESYAAAVTALRGRVHLLEQQNAELERGLRVARRTLLHLPSGLHYQRQAQVEVGLGEALDVNDRDPERMARARAILGPTEDADEFQGIRDLAQREINEACAVMAPERPLRPEVGSSFPAYPGERIEGLDGSDPGAGSINRRPGS